MNLKNEKLPNNTHTKFRPSGRPFGAIKEKLSSKVNKVAPKNSDDKLHFRVRHETVRGMSVRNLSVG